MSEDSLDFGQVPQSNEEKILALMERVSRQEAVNELLAAAIGAMALTHPDRDALLEEWRHISSGVISRIQLDSQRNRALAWKADEVARFFRDMDAIISGPPDKDDDD